MSRRTLKEIGRAKLKSDKVMNSEAAGLYSEGEAVQYYIDGWRFGHVIKTAQTGYRAGMVCIKLPCPVGHGKGKTPTAEVWVKASDVRKIQVKALRALADTADKPVYTVQELAVLMGFSRQTITTMFENEPGVIVRAFPEKMRKRGYRSIRIPVGVYRRVLGRMTR